MSRHLKTTEIRHYHNHSETQTKNKAHALLSWNHPVFYNVIRFFCWVKLLDLSIIADLKMN